MGKTSTQEQQVKLPPEIKEAALKNLGLAEQVGQLPYAPNFGLQVAGFTPQQTASFDNANSAAQAFGLPSTSGGGLAGMPAPSNVGGFTGYSTEALYKDMMSKVPPQVLAMYNAFFGSPAKPPTPASPVPAGRPVLGGGVGAPGMMGTPGSGTYDWSLNGGQGGFRYWGQ